MITVCVCVCVRACVRTPVANLGVSGELQAKLQDVMVLRTLLTIGKVLGEGNTKHQFVL